MSVLKLPQVHPDDMVRRCFWSPSARIPSATRIATTVHRCAATCIRPGCGSSSWVLKATTGHARNKRKLIEPIAVCIVCGFPWDTWDEVNHMATGAPGGGVTRRGRWTRFIHVKSSRGGGSGRGPEEHIFGKVNVYELLRLRKIATELLRSRLLYWEVRVYFTYVLQFSGVRGRGGERALARWAAGHATGRHRAGSWPRAPFRWSRDRVAGLIQGGRREWADRLVRARLIEGGDWWLSGK